VLGAKASLDRGFGDGIRKWRRKWHVKIPAAGPFSAKVTLAFFVHLAAKK